ncbi:hypothetical protein CP533_0437 [Ophiocordyceps camponoti-saundersi (nom. inval.)]|nr:hypothetical protein CP533_0437 [Ophiocordyceps camponoti-saundersi (nom. inval.)]
MAVSRDINGLSVAVKIDGQKATEYPVPEDFDYQQLGRDSQEQPICCFIESLSGLSFSVEASTTSSFKASPPFDHIILFVYVDGNYISGAYKTFSWGPVTLKIDRSYETCSTSGCVERRRLIFSAVSGVDDATNATVARDIKVASKMGTIKAMIYLGYGGELHQPVASRSKIPKNNSALKVAEKAMKGRELTHGATLSTDFTVERPRPQFHFAKTQLIATFLFLYRSRSALRKEMVLPLSPSPPPALLEDKKPLGHRKKSCRSSVEGDANVKSKKIKSCDDLDFIDLTGFAASSGVKVESAELPKKAKIKGDPTVIDLTSD